MSSDALDQAAVKEAVADFPDPETGRPVTTLDQVEIVSATPQRLEVRLKLTTFAAPVWEETRRNFESLLRNKFPDVGEIEVEQVVHERPAEKIGEIGLTSKAVIAVGSGKGGVGKSTVASCLALGLLRKGCKVGLLDADVYGPSIPHLLGVDQRPEAIDKRLQPVRAGDLRVMSMGIPRAAWRGCRLAWSDAAWCNHAVSP